MSATQTEKTQATEFGTAMPQQGDKYHCEKCGMALQVTVGCSCPADDHAHFHCCGEEMKKG
jgi:hypothetical protein